MSQQEDFQRRLAKIGTQAPEPQAETYDYSQDHRAHRSGPNPALEFLMVPVAALSGFGSVLFARWVQFHYLTDEGEFGLDAGGLAGGFLGDIVIAIVVSLVLVEILNLKSPARRWAEIAGFVGGLFAMEAVVALAPAFFAGLFSEEWVLLALYGY